MPEFHKYLEKIKSGLKSSFDLIPCPVKTSISYDLYGEMNIENRKFALVKEAKIYSYENREFLFLRHAEELNRELIAKELDELHKRAKEIVSPHRDHMSSHISLVIVTSSPVEKEAIALAKKFHRQKGFSLGFKGWADIYLTLVSLAEAEIWTHKKNLKSAAFFRPEEKS